MARYAAIIPCDRCAGPIHFSDGTKIIGLDSPTNLVPDLSSLDWSPVIAAAIIQDFIGLPQLQKNPPVCPFDNAKACRIWVCNHFAIRNSTNPNR
jgi:hypothetical protein